MTECRYIIDYIRDQYFVSTTVTMNPRKITLKQINTDLGDVKSSLSDSEIGNFTYFLLLFIKQ